MSEPGGGGGSRVVDDGLLGSVFDWLEGVKLDWHMD